MPLDAIQLPFNCYKIVIKLSWNCIAASLFQRCIGVSQRRIPMLRYGSSAVLVYFSAPLFAASLLQPRTGGFWPLTRVPAPRWWTPALLSYIRFEVFASPWCFSATYFYAVFGFHAALTDSNDPFLRSLAAPAPHGWTPAFHAHATSCEQRSCTRDTGEQLLRRSLAATNKDKERRLSPLNQPLDSLNFAMIVPYVHPYRYLLPVGPHVCSFSIVFCELKCNGSFKGIIRLI